MTDYTDLPPPPGPELSPFTSQEGVEDVARHICERGHLSEAALPVLQQMTALASASPSSSAKLLGLLIDRALPPAPSRAETWWLQATREVQLPETMSMQELSRWLVDNIKRGQLTPAIAAELVAQFRVLDAIGGFSQPGESTGQRPRLVRSR